MTIFPVHSSETAPEGSKPILAAAQKKFGFVPNLFRVMAEAPAAGEAYMAVMDIFENSSLFDAEKQTKSALNRTSAVECRLLGVKRTYRRHGSDFRV